MERENGYNVEADKKQIADLFEGYVRMILHEYKDKIPSNISQRLSNITNFSDYVHIENTGTISLFATPNDSVIHLPLDAYKAISALSMTSEYGSDKSHKTHDDSNMIINDNTFRDFVEHVILKGETPVEYFKEILLHETMHICGSDGAFALSEGFNELKTREMAQKYGLETSCCGYPKETKIAYELQQLFGKDICDRLAFSDLTTRFNILRNELGEEAVQLYANVYSSMERQFRPYMEKKYPGLNGIREKCAEYDKIDYTETYNYINQYRTNKEQSLQSSSYEQGNVSISQNNVNATANFNANPNPILEQNKNVKPIEQNAVNQTTKPFQTNKNIQWNNESEKERFNSLKATKEQTYTKPMKKVLVKTMPQFKSSGFINIMAINFFIGFSISLFFLFSLFLFSK